MKRANTRSRYPMEMLLERALGRRRFKKYALGSKAQTIRVGGRVLREEDILLPEEVASRLKVPVSWVYEKTRARCRNPIPCLRMGRYIRFDWKAIVEWLTKVVA